VDALTMSGAKKSKGKKSEGKRKRKVKYERLVGTLGGRTGLKKKRGGRGNQYGKLIPFTWHPTAHRNRDGKKKKKKKGAKTDGTCPDGSSTKKRTRKRPQT